MHYFLYLCSLFLVTPFCFAQPGPIPKELYFQVFVNGKNVLETKQPQYSMQWRNIGDYKNNWTIATIENNQFKTDKIQSDRGATELKIYQKYSMDTMFISCHHNINAIPFQKGTFTLDRSTNYLANMQTFNGVKILNQDWNNYKDNNAGAMHFLIKNRYCYFTKAASPFDEDEDPDVNNISYKKSGHLIEEKGEVVQDYISLGKLYYAPQLSSSIYSIGFVNDDNATDEKYSQYFLESTDGCKSWKIKFPIHDNTADLITLNQQNFIISNAYPNNQLSIYNAKGKIIDSMTISEEPCGNSYNIFYPCDKTLKFTNNNGIETSNPFMDNGSMEHVFYKELINGFARIKIDTLPFYPKSISASLDAGATWKKIIELPKGETYVYLTGRKNKLVLVSYHYTMVSTDFGKTWTFYNNGTFNGGEWNFIWLDDNTLVNVTNYYADTFIIP
jgi:hypothetical protein